MRNASLWTTSSHLVLGVPTDLVLITITIIITGTISKSTKKYVSNIPGNHEVKELKKTAILGTAHIRYFGKC
jgi:hypothetical protein